MKVRRYRVWAVEEENTGPLAWFTEQEDAQDYMSEFTILKPTMRETIIVANEEA